MNHVMTETHENRTINTFFDSERNIRIVHRSVRRGGCLHIGYFVISYRNTGVIISVDSTMAPDTDITDYLTALADKHRAAEVIAVEILDVKPQYSQLSFA